MDTRHDTPQVGDGVAIGQVAVPFVGELVRGFLDDTRPKRSNKPVMVWMLCFVVALGVAICSCVLFACYVQACCSLRAGMRNGHGVRSLALL